MAKAKSTASNLNTFNKVKTALTNNGAKVITPNNLSFAGYNFTFHLPKTIKVIDTKGTTTIDVDNKAQLALVIELIREKINEKKSGLKQTNSVATTEEPVETQPKEEQTMSTNHMSPEKITASLLKNKWVQDKYGILTSPKDVMCKFNLKSVQLVNQEADVKCNIPTATTTDGQFIEYLKAVIKGEKPKTKRTKDLTAPKGYADFMESLTNMEKEAKKEVADKKKADEDKEKPAPVMVENPNKDGSSPVFDALNVAITETDKVEKKLQAAWSSIASQFDYSIKDMTAALHAEGKWPNKVSKKTGQPIPDPDNFLQPAGYKSVYNDEKEAGINGVGHMVNTASRMFAKYNPTLEAARAKAQEEQAEKSKETASSDTLTEKDVDKILMEMSKLAKKLNTADLKSWLETDPTVSGVFTEMAENGPDSLGDIVDTPDDTDIDETDDLDSLVDETPADETDELDELAGL